MSQADTVLTAEEELEDSEEGPVVSKKTRSTPKKAVPSPRQKKDPASEEAPQVVDHRFEYHNLNNVFKRLVPCSLFVGRERSNA